MKFAAFASVGVGGRRGGMRDTGPEVISRGFAKRVLRLTGIRPRWVPE